MTFYTKYLSLAVVSFVALAGCGSPSDGNPEAVEQSAGSAGTAGKTGTSGTSGSSAAGASGSAGSIPSGSAGMFGGDSGSGGKAGCESIIDCSDVGGVCAFDKDGDAYCVNPCDNAKCPADQVCHIVDKLAKCEGGTVGSAGTSGSSGSSAAGAAGSSAGSAGASAGSSGSAGSAAGSAGSSAGSSGSSGSSGSICSTAQAGAWCPVEQAGTVCGALVCNGVWTPVGTGGSAGSAGSAGASGSSGNAGTAGSAGSGELMAGEIGEFSFTVAFKEAGSHKLDIFAFESSGAFAWGNSPNASGTETRITWKTVSHWGATVELNGFIDSGSSQLCNNMAATEPMWATFKRSNGTVLPLRAATTVSTGGGCHLQYKLELCATDSDPDCDGKTGAQGDTNQSIGQGQAMYPGAIETSNDNEDFNGDGNDNPTSSDLGQVYVRMTGMPHGVTARFYDDLNWVDGGIAMSETSNGVYDTNVLSAKPKSFYVTWTPSVNGKNSSAGVQGGICISNVSTVSVFNSGNNTVATTTTPTLDQNCHWSAIYN